MLRNKINAVLIVNLAVFNKVLLIFDTHAVFRNKAAGVAVMVAQVNQNIVNTRLVDFPAAVRVHLAARHLVAIKEPLRHKRRLRVHRAVATLHATRLIVVNAEQVDFPFRNQETVFRLAGGQLVVRFQQRHQIRRVFAAQDRVEEAAVKH